MPRWWMLWPLGTPPMCPPRPPHLLSTLRLVDLEAPDTKKVLEIRCRIVMLALPKCTPAQLRRLRCSSPVPLVCIIFIESRVSVLLEERRGDAAPELVLF